MTQSGVNVVEANVYDSYNFKAYLLRDLLVGSYTIKHKPWKPKDNDMYYYVNKVGNIEYDEWLSFWEDIILYKLGNCYRTIEEAEANKDKWLKFYESDEVLEVR